MAHEITSAQKLIDSKTGKQIIPRLTVNEDNAALVALTGSGGKQFGSESSPLPVGAKTLEELMFDNNRMLARWLNANELLDAEDLAIYLV